MIDRLVWSMKYEKEVVSRIEKLDLKDNQGIVMYDHNHNFLYPKHPHRFDILSEIVTLAFKRGNDVKYRFIENQCVPLYIGKIVSFRVHPIDNDYIDHIIGDLYSNTKHLVKYWKIKRKIQHFFYKINRYHRYKLNKKLKRLDKENENKKEREKDM